MGYDNQLVQVSYHRIEEVVRSAVGDPVRLCLVDLPTDCPTDDSRGKTYETTNKRTNETWTMSDSTHSCGDR